MYATYSWQQPCTCRVHLCVLVLSFPLVLNLISGLFGQHGSRNARLCQTNLPYRINEWFAQRQNLFMTRFSVFNVKTHYFASPS